ncbi:uncharacterized protein LOC130736425 [Lotus japonicus]|uniref:uncharacterized protein LOC130736425 n=1 Tax=Lotus japonicus TaxID=34305 RepID=UPI00258B2CFE|nr:uncharacterized protein LOC130736425 [Lotus japonicus]
MARALKQLTTFLTEQAERAGQGTGQGAANNQEEIYHGLDKFLKRSPPKFEGGYNPDGAYEWVQELERIFETLVCAEPRKVAFTSYLLSGKARTWWTSVRGRITSEEGELTWEIFKNSFLEKYFPADAKGRKEMEFLELKQEAITANDEKSKCIKFEYGLRPDIRTAVGHDQIQNFATLVEKCRIFEENEKTQKEYLKGIGVNKAPKKKEEERKPYLRPQDQGRNQFRRTWNPTGGSGFQGRPGGFNNTPFCVRCRRNGHRAQECIVVLGGQSGVQLGGSGNPNPTTAVGEESNRNANVPLRDNRRVGRPPNKGKVFAMTMEEAPKSPELIEGATHLFISHERVKQFGLPVTSLAWDLEISTPTKNTSKTSED